MKCCTHLFSQLWHSTSFIFGVWSDLCPCVFVHVCPSKHLWPATFLTARVGVCPFSNCTFQCTASRFCAFSRALATVSSCSASSCICIFSLRRPHTKLSRNASSRWSQGKLHWAARRQTSAMCMAIDSFTYWLWLKRFTIIEDFGSCNLPMTGSASLGCQVPADCAASRR